MSACIVFPITPKRCYYFTTNCCKNIELERVSCVDDGRRPSLLRKAGTKQNISFFHVCLLAITELDCEMHT